MMAKMKALRSFTDASTGKLVMEGREFDCDEANAKLLASTRAAEPVASGIEPKRAPARQRRSKRK